MKDVEKTNVERNNSRKRIRRRRRWNNLYGLAVILLVSYGRNNDLLYVPFQYKRDSGFRRIIYLFGRRK